MTGPGPEAPARGTRPSLVPVATVTEVMGRVSPAHRCRSHLHLVVTVMVGAILVVTAFTMRRTLGEAFAALFSLDRTTLLAVVGCWALVVLARGLLYRSSLTRGTLAQGLVLDQVNLAVGNAVPGGAVVGATLRYQIGHSFGHSPEQMALCLVAVGEGVSVGRWVLVLLVLAESALTGTASGLDVGIMGLAALALGASA